MKSVFKSTLQRKALALLFVTTLTFVALFGFLPTDLVVALLIVAFVVFLYFGLVVGLTKYNHRTPDWLTAAPLWLIVLIPIIVGIVLLYLFWTDVTLLGAIFLLGMMFIFLYYWLLVPFALIQKVGQQRWDRNNEITDYPPISVLIPAYRERGHISTTLDSLAQTIYPSEVELIVIDDGSLDGTYEEARDHRGIDPIVIQKENGGKHSALNCGLEEASHEIIVSIDADSWIAPDALTKLIEGFKRHPEAGAIAGNVKVGNRGLFITNVQAFEYILGINTFRRAFDHVGLVSVVPGCLGAFRKRTLHEVKGYSADTLTEDFDLTIEILKRGEPVHMSEGVVYTYAPTTWHGLYRQRLRWFRGHVQTIRKHAAVFGDHNYGLLQRLVFPYALLSMSLFPLLGLTVALVIVLMVTWGETLLLLQLAAFFLLLVVILTVMAIEIDEESRWLTLYAPLSVIGYKQFMDLILLKSVVDVFSNRDLRWTSDDQIQSSELELVYDPSPDDGKLPSFQLYEHDNEWVWRLRSRNGRTLATSCRRGPSKEKAEQTIDVLRKHAQQEIKVAVSAGATDSTSRFEVCENEDGSWWWRLTNESGIMIAESGRGHASKHRAQLAFETACKRASEASVSVTDQPERRT